MGRVAAEYFRSGFDRQGVVKPWSARYEGHDAPHVNIAGLVSDLSKGRPPKARRFEARPAGLDTGALRKSIASRVVGDAVEVGSTLPYAGRFHAGGESSQDITPTVRKGLSKFLRKKAKAGEGDAFRKKLGWLFAKKVLVTKIHARPLVGWTEELREQIMDTVADYMGEAGARKAREPEPERDLNAAVGSEGGDE